VIRRVIDKWLKAWAMEEGRLIRSEAGSPQGGVVSPIMANAFLHEVMDMWFESEVKPRLQGHAFMVRYCDDMVAVFSHEDDARKVMRVLPKRFGKYGLSLHPEKRSKKRIRGNYCSIVSFRPTQNVKQAVGAANAREILFSEGYSRLAFCR
jgi:retron-type reverse transcriptase